MLLPPLIRPVRRLSARLVLAGVPLLLAISTAAFASPDELARTPPMGWSSWNAFGCAINEQLILQSVDALVASRLNEAGYQYVNIDDCWMAPVRDELGNLQSDPVRFPHGIAAIADYVHSRGLKLGIYASAGTTTCSGWPGSLGYEAQDARQFADWGVDYLKYDDCGDYLGRSDIQRYTAMRDALLATGRPIVYSLSNWGQQNVWTWGATLAHLWRTTFDITASWDRVMWILDQQVGLEAYSGPGHWNDPDMLEVGNEGLTPDEARAHFSLWALLNAPLFAGNDLRSMSPDVEATLSDVDVIAVNQDWAGIQGHRIRDDGAQEVWFKPMSDGSAAIVLLNRSDVAAPIAVSPSEVRLRAATEYAVKDLWTDEIRSVRDHYSTTVAPHAVVMVRMSPKRNDGSVYLSDLVWTSALNGWGPVERDSSNGERAASDGGPLTLGGVRFAKGLGVHANSDVRYALNGVCSALTAVIGVDDQVGANGTVTFEVWTDGVLRYQSGVMSGATGTANVSVPLNGARELALIVTDAGDGPASDHADWADLQVSCAGTSSYLSDWSITSMTSGWGPVERDRSNGEIGAHDGRTLSIGGIPYAKGLGVHSSSAVRFAVNNSCSTLSALVGVDDEVGVRGSVIFQVWTDSALRYQSDVMMGGSAAASVAVDLTGVRDLALVVTDSGDGMAYDHADWANLHVSCIGTLNQVSADGTQVSPGAQIIDSDFAVWTLDGDQTMRNGVWAGYGTASLLRYRDNRLYALSDADGMWYVWDGNAWWNFYGTEPQK